MYPKIDYHGIFYTKVAASSEQFCPGCVVPNGDIVGIYRFRANGADPSSYVLLAWDYGGDAEKVFSSTKGDIDIIFDPSLTENQIVGDGVKSLKIVIINDSMTTSPYIGGSFELIKIG